MKSCSLISRFQIYVVIHQPYYHFSTPQTRLAFRAICSEVRFVAPEDPLDRSDRSDQCDYFEVTVHALGHHEQYGVKSLEEQELHQTGIDMANAVAVGQAGQSRHTEPNASNSSATMQQRKRTGSVGVRAEPDADSASSSYRTGSAPPRDREHERDSIQPEEGMQVAGQRERTSTISADPRAATPASAAPIEETPQIEQLLADGLRVPKDRMLLLRSDLEIEKFVNDAS